jgi:tetratricopeptide (TPR) repeat protein
MSNEAACRTTHPQILAGNCPWCGAAIGAESQADATGERRWDISRLKADLNHQDDEIRMITIRNVGYHLPDVTDAVNVLRIALSNSEERVRSEATLALASLGDRLTAEAIDSFEVASLKRKQQDDLAVRIVLLGYYDGKRLRSEATREARQAHVFWVIEHAPRSFIAETHYAHFIQYRDGPVYRQGREMWMALVEDNPEDTVILNNAASFLRLSDKAKSEELLKRASSLEPDDPRWPRKLAQLYWSEMLGKDAATRRSLAAMAQAEYERAQGLYRDERERLGQLHLLAQAAFEAGDYPKADTHASELLSKAEAGHRNNFYGNQILGRLALAAGDVERAKSHLLASAETAGCPLWSITFGSMVLAKELLGRGERETVLRFLERCAALWPESAEWLTRAVTAIERGETPFLLFSE